MIFTEERLDEILNIISREGKVFVKQLSKQFNVTDDMIRKDLQKLHSAGKLQRTYGGAIAISRTNVDTSPFSNRLITNREQKQLVASAAYLLIDDYATVCIDVSSSNYILAELIAANNRPVTIVTNMLQISELFSENSKTELIFIGGQYHKKIGATIGAAAIAAANDYLFDCAFIGCCGVDIKSGSVYNFDPDEGRTKQAFIRNAKTSYLVAENNKFQQDGVFRFSNIGDYSGLITDSEPVPKIKAALKKYKLSLHY